MRINGTAGEIAVAATADRVKAFERKAKRIYALMARGTLRIAGVPGDELAHGQAVGRNFVCGKLRDLSGRAWQLFAQQHLADPVSPQDRAGTGSP